MKPRTLPLKVYSWFCANPDEELTSADICMRWDVGSGAVFAGMEGLVQKGLLKVEQRELLDLNGKALRVTNVYSAGPELLMALEAA